MNAGEARQLYERVTALDSFESSLQLAPDTPDREALLKGVAEALHDLVPVDGRLSLAPSPWHAFFHLWLRHADARSRGSAAFFRGHNCAGLPRLMPALHRLDSAATRRAGLAVDILKDLLERSEILHFKGDDRTVLARTIAQHYGVATSLLDVSLDPAVAVFFASCGNDAIDGSAFVFDWQHCEAVGLPIVIPPVSPWSRRLEVQRGFFLDFDALHGLDVQDVPFEVRFLRHPGFEVRRAGASFVPWPIDEPEVQALLSWIDGATERHDGFTPALRAELDARAHTRGFLAHQLDVVLGFSLDAPPGAPQQDRMQQVVRQQLIASVTQVDRFVNHLCLQPGGLDAARMHHLRASNRSVFDQYVKQLVEMRSAGRLDEPQYTRVLEILQAADG
jgi:FRG domain